MKSLHFFKKTHIYSRILLLLISLFSTCILCSCAASAPITKTGFYFDTFITVTVYSSKDVSLLEDCFALAEKYENLFSRTLEGSDIYRINHAKGTPTEVSKETISLLQTALSYAKLSNGKVDPTIGAVSQLWDFHDNSEPKIPSDSALKEALTHVDYTKITINNNTVTLSDPEIVLDLGFIAKGYIADQMKAYLLSKNVKSALINLGGNVLTLGSKPDNSAFVIGIQKPFADTGVYATTIPVSDRSVVSSGVYERSFTADDKLYHHLLDTQTGYPIENDLLAVSILSDSSTDGDALSTTCFALGYNEASALIESLENVDAIFILKDGTLKTTY